MEQSGGQIAVKLAKPPDGGGEDRLSALPDDVLVLILACLDTTAEAARTSVLARRWRSLWALLPNRRFDRRPDGNRIRELLEAAPGAPDDPPPLRSISVTTEGAGADSVMAWLPAAARRLAGGGLVYRDMARDPGNFDEEEEARRRGSVQLPCFEKATTIELGLRFLGLVLPSLGVFTQLADLPLSSVEFRGPCELGDVVSSPRCPCLQKLRICDSRGLGNLSIHSDSLLQMKLNRSVLWQLTIVTPTLQKLSVKYSFFERALNQLVVNITAPQIVSLLWRDLYDPQYFHLGNLRQLQELQTNHFWVYGDQLFREYNHYCLSLLQRFQVLYSLHLKLIYYQDICRDQFLLGDITALPQITFLHLDLYNYAHSFGACLFHLLRMCIGLRRLSLVLHGPSNLEVELACPSRCICDQPENWKTDELVLGHLEDVRIIGLQGAKHEVASVQRLLGWAVKRYVCLVW